MNNNKIDSVYLFIITQLDFGKAIELKSTGSESKLKTDALLDASN